MSTRTYERNLAPRQIAAEAKKSEKKATRSYVTRSYKKFNNRHVYLWAASDERRRVVVPNKVMVKQGNAGTAIISISKNEVSSAKKVVIAYKYRWIALIMMMSNEAPLFSIGVKGGMNGQPLQPFIAEMVPGAFSKLKNKQIYLHMMKSELFEDDPSLMNDQYFSTSNIKVITNVYVPCMYTKLKADGVELIEMKEISYC